MKKFFVLTFASLASFSQFVSACGIDGHESEVVSNGVIGFGFVGGFVSALVIVAIVLGVMLSFKKNERGRR